MPTLRDRHACLGALRWLTPWLAFVLLLPAAIGQGVENPLTATDVADVIAYALNAPGHVNLDLITMRPVAQSAQHLLARGPLRVRGGSD